MLYAKWIMANPYTDKVFYIDGYCNKKINVYNNYENLKAKKCENIIELPHEVSVSYSVIHKGYFYYFKYMTNNINKYDINEKKILMNKNILPDAILENQTDCWGGYNDINLISDDNNLYAVYASNNSNKRISIALLDENNLNVIKTWKLILLRKNNVELFL